MPQLDGVLISHAHLDHTGGLPFLEHYRMVCPIFLTHQTLPIVKILLKDSYKIAHVKRLHPAWGKTDLAEVAKDAHRVQFDKWYRHRKLKFLFLNAGHIPGSAMILCEAEGKRILYTGDFNTRTTKLMAPAEPARIAREHGPIDVLITESTYGHRGLPKREEVEAAFLAKLREVLDRGGTALVPVFALGRAQEILLLLAEQDPGCPIHFDGMSKEITRKILTHQSSYVERKDALNRMLYDRVELVASDAKRRQATEGGPCVILTTSGMLQGGPAISYLRRLWHDPRNAVLLTGYQVHGTNGRRLLEEGVAYMNGYRTPVKCEVAKFDFSGHADLEDVKRAIWQLEPKRLVIQHGDPESVENLAAWARQETPCRVNAPRVGDSIEVE